MSIRAGAGWKVLHFAVEYSNHPLDEDEFLRTADAQGSGLSVSGGSVRFLSISASLRYNLPVKTRASPFFAGGVGLFRASISDLSATGGEQVFIHPLDKFETKFGYNLGMGLDVRTGARTGLFCEYRITTGLTGEGSDFSHTTLRFGFFYRLILLGWVEWIFYERHRG